MTVDTYKRLGVVRYRQIQKADTMADKVGLYICPAINWETDVIWVRKKVTFETLFTGTLDQAEIYINRLWELRAFL